VASRSISVRLDELAQRALDDLTRGGRDQSEAVREALVEAASRRRSDSLAAEAAALAADEDDRAEAARVSALMESLRGEG
jgi:Arc/MetJ-type ribon-helix-helix transcriptional regulator